MSSGDGDLITYRKRSTTRKIILHESHTPASVRNVTAYLRARGRVNGLLEVGYHYVIEPDGTPWSTRAWDTVGSHCPGENHDSIGICLGGDADTDWWGPERIEQRMALRQFCGIIWSLLQDWSVPVLGHDEAMPRRKKRHGPCPSFDMEKMRAYINQASV